MPPTTVQLKIRPDERFDVIDVRPRLAERVAAIEDHEHLLLCSHHTTAGFLEPDVARALDHEPGRIRDFVQRYRSLFPAGAPYRHDELHLRTELTEEQRKVEPRNGDSHLTFIGSGMRNCVTYDNAPGTPACFIELDGVNGPTRRERLTTAIGFDEDEAVHEELVEIPASASPIDAVNLADPRLALFTRLDARLKELGVECGRVDISLPEEETDAALTVNEHETLLMRHDVREVLHDPLRFVAEHGRSALADPRAVPRKTLDYARFDAVRVAALVLARMGRGGALVEKVLRRLARTPAERFLELQRTLSMAACPPAPGRPAELVSGRYQTPILLHWRAAAGPTRRLCIRINRLG